MLSSCCNTNLKKGRKDCPECGQSCLPVSRQTMLHQVRFPANQNLAEGDYVFCVNQGCSVAYFSTSYVIPKTDLRVFQGNQTDMLCYCFDISKATYRAALADGTAKAKKDFVVRQTKAKLCACESRNPSGRCCLVSFKQMEEYYDS